MMSGIRNLLVVLNEDSTQPHVDVRNGLGELKNRGEIGDYRIFSWRTERNKGMSPDDILVAVAHNVTEFNADALLWTHAAGLKISSGLSTKNVRAASFPVLGYWEGDVYESPFKKLPREVIHLAVSADVVFCQGFGSMTDTLKKTGRVRIEYVPAPTDKWRFMQSRIHTSGISYDVIMIGNNVSSRFPWRTMPGARWRRELVSFFQKKLGSRFIVFGDGWSGPCAGGPIPFDQQARSYHSGRVALGVNNLHAKYYFSNRLPIAMSCGVPVAHNYERGFEEIFDEESGLSFFRNTTEAWNVVKGLLEKTQGELDAIGSRALAFSSSRFSVTTILHFIVRMLAACKEQRDRGRKFGDPGITNPWIGRAG